MLVVKMAKENSTWGYRRIQGALAVVGHRVAHNTEKKILREHGIDPAPERCCPSGPDVTFATSTRHPIVRVDVCSAARSANECQAHRAVSPAGRGGSDRHDPGVLTGTMNL